MKTGFRKRWYLILLVPAGFAVFGYITMLLWNALMPGIFHLPEITFWQTIGLMILSRLLLGGFGGHRNHCRDDWRYKMHEKWDKMTPEEREQFKEHIRLHRPPWLNRYPGKGKSEQA